MQRFLSKPSFFNKFYLAALLTLVSIGSPDRAFALTPKQIVISEVAWMGTTNSTADEWIELLNTTATDIDLSGWTLYSGDGSQQYQDLRPI